MNKLILILLLINARISGYAQSAPAYTTIGDTTGVTIHADPRLEIVTRYHKQQQTSGNGSKPTGSIRSVRGFRVQIYNGNDRAEATRIKLDFMRRFPGTPTYLTYRQPQFRVKVGDYTLRADAQRMYQRVSKLYMPCMIVPDIIESKTLNTQNND